MSEPIGLFPESDLISDEIGEVEQSYLDQIKELERIGVMNTAHSGIKALVLKAARSVDRMKISDAASGQANLLKALNDIASRLPQPPEKTTSALAELRTLITGSSLPALPPHTDHR